MLNGIRLAILINFRERYRERLLRDEHYTPSYKHSQMNEYEKCNFNAESEEK
jgi:hypothetical protein